MDGKLDKERASSVLEVSLLHDFGHQDAEIKAAIMREYNIAAEDADNYLKNLL